MPDAATAPAPESAPPRRRASTSSTTEVESFLDANARRKEAEKKFVWGEGSDNVAMFEERDREPRAPCSPRPRRGGPSGSTPASAGSPAARVRRPRSAERATSGAYDALEAQYEVPNQSFFGIGLGMVAPTILAHATRRRQGPLPAADVPRRHRRPASSSPSRAPARDLASLQTKAERDGDEWVITGQKVWTSGAQYSDIGEIIARTDPDLPKHKGLTGFIVDMRAPGVEIRPLRQMTGGASFNEVFFNEVRVPDDHRLGDVNQGWTVALTTLMNERAAIGAGGGAAAAAGC